MGKNKLLTATFVTGVVAVLMGLWAPSLAGSTAAQIWVGLGGFTALGSIVGLFVKAK